MQYVLIYALLILILIYLFFVIPGKRKHKAKQEMHDSIRAGDTVITMGGIVAVVVEREEDTLIIRLMENQECFMRILVYAIQQVVNKAQQAPEGAAEEK